MKCEIKTGFFIQRACSGDPKERCASCEKNMCVRHTVLFDNKKICVSCFEKGTKLDRENESQKRRISRSGNNKGIKSGRSPFENDAWHDRMDVWYYMYRDHFYTSSRYSPFNDEDYAAFESNPDNVFYEEGDNDSFFDS